MIGDSHAALVGHGAFAAGAVKASFGTGTSVMAPTDRIVHSPKLSTTIGWSRRVGDATEAIPAIEGNIYATGAALSWASELLGLADVSLLDTVAGRCADAGGVSFVPALAGLGAPHWDPEARGTITGITRHAGPPQIARAAMEAVAHQVADVVEEMRRILGRDVEALHTDGGAMRSELLSQVVADLVGVTVMRSDEPELAALGAASLAGLHVGLWRDLDALRELPRAVRHVAPSMGAAERLRRRAEWADAVARTCARVR
jgi:glycerol kinase